MSRPILRYGAVCTLAALGLLGSWRIERTSVERANRLQRSGDAVEAAALYEERSRRAPDAEVRYNLGTALLAADDPAAEEELGLAIGAVDREVRGRAQYNTGLLKLRDALAASTPDSVRSSAAAAVGANRAALRLEPDDSDAKWNLAMALRLLDSIDSEERRSGREQTEGAIEADVVTRSVNVPDAAEDERAEDPPAEGEEETVAIASEERPLTADEAAAILGISHLDATQILGKLLALEGRSRWGRRPSSGVRRW